MERPKRARALSALGRARQRVLAGVTVLIGVSVGAEVWTMDKTAWKDAATGEWRASCHARLGGGAALSYERVEPPALYLLADTNTVDIRRERGDDDPLRPVVYIRSVQVNKGRARPLSLNGGFGEVCGGGGYSDLSCEPDLREYRIRYQLDAAEFSDAWLEYQHVSYDFGWSFELLGVDRRLVWQDAWFESWAIWPDWPPELFDTDGFRSFRVNFGGLRTTPPVLLLSDRDENAHHVSSIRFTYQYGMDALAAVARCVDDHVRYGRLDANAASGSARSVPLMAPGWLPPRAPLGRGVDP